MNVVTLQIVVGMDPMGDIEISWYEAASGASPANDSQKRWVWRHSPDGYVSGVWCWLKDYRFPVELKHNTPYPPSSGFCMLLTNAFYRTEDDSILNPTSVVTEPYIAVYNPNRWNHGTLAPVGPFKPWFGNTGIGDGVALFKEKNTTRKDVVTGKTEPFDYPPSGPHKLLWFSRLGPSLWPDYNPYDEKYH